MFDIFNKSAVVKPLAPKKEGLILLTPAQAGERLGGLSEHQVKRLIRSGKLRAMKPTRKGWRVPTKALEEFVEQQMKLVQTRVKGVAA